MASFGRSLILLVLIMVGSVFLHSYRFHQVEYRQDEINTVHAGAVLDAAGIVEWLSYEGTHPPGWRIFAADWVGAFGYERNIARFQSTLFTLLALALTFRLGEDLFDAKTGLMAVLFIGLLPYAQWHFHELRPYAPLIMISAAMQVIFLRWLRRPNWQMALAYIVLGGIGLQTHYFTGFVVVAHGIFLLVALNWQPRQLAAFVGMGTTILLSFAWWFPAIYHGTFVVRDGGLRYGSDSIERSVTTFLTDLNYAPLVLFPLLFVSTRRIYPALPSASRMDVRFQDWRRWFVIVTALGIFLSAALANDVVQLLTFRNLSVTLPLLGVAFGFFITAVPRYVNGIAVAAYILLASTTFIYYAPQVPHSEMATFMNEELSARDKFIVHINFKGATAPAAVHYFRDHLNGQPAIDRFFVVNELNSDRVGFEYNIDPFSYEVAQDTFVEEDLDTFGQFLTDTDRVYYILYRHWRLEDNIYHLRPQFEEILLRDFEAVREKSWYVEGNDPEAGFTVIEYRRKAKT